MISLFNFGDKVWIFGHLGLIFDFDIFFTKLFDANNSFLAWVGVIFEEGYQSGGFIRGELYSRVGFIRGSTV